MRNIWPCLVFLFTLTGVSRPALASVDDALKTLGFEDASEWTIENGTIVGTTVTRTQGAAGLAFNAPGYTVLHSRLLGPLGVVSPTLSFDLLLPNIQPAPAWRGAVQLFVNVPSQGVYNAYLGQIDLTGVAPGVFQRMQFTVPADVLPKLRANYSDLSFSIVFNVPSAANAGYVIDNLEVSSTIPPNSTVGDAEKLPILGFETKDGWQISAGTVQGLSVTASQGNFSLAVKPQGYAVLTSRPLPSIGPVDPTFSFDIRLPSEQANPNWFGTVQLLVSIPSKGVYNAYLGQNELTPLPLGQFSTLHFNVPPNLLPALNGSYTDLQFSIVLNVPQGAPGIYDIDNLRIGALTTPPVVLPPNTPIRRDLVGLISSGVVHIAADGDSASPGLTLGALYVEERDQACVPASARACRYIVHLSRFRVGAFSLLSTDFSGVQIFNEEPFEVVLGGSGPSSLSSPIPSNVLFAIVIEGQHKGFSAFPGSASSITIDPSGNGMIAMTGQLHATVDGHGVDFDFSTVADSPLANRPPVANAGPDLSGTSTTTCEVAVTLNGTASSDPDGNLVSWRWLEGSTLWGNGPTLTAKLHHSGTHVLTLEAIDSFGSMSQDNVLVTATLPSACH